MREPTKDYQPLRDAQQEALRPVTEKFSDARDELLTPVAKQPVEEQQTELVTEHPQNWQDILDAEHKAKILELDDKREQKLISERDFARGLKLLDVEYANAAQQEKDRAGEPRPKVEDLELSSDKEMTDAKRAKFERLGALTGMDFSAELDQLDNEQSLSEGREL